MLVLFIIYKKCDYIVATFLKKEISFYCYLEIQKYINDSIEVLGSNRTWKKIILESGQIK